MYDAKLEFKNLNRIRTMKIDVKSILWSLTVVGLYIIATVGVIKLFWNTDDEYMFEGRVKFILYILILFNLIYIIGIYHLVGPHKTDLFYETLIYGHLLYLVIGGLSYIFKKQS
jgi:hypothetical protein